VCSNNNNNKRKSAVELLQESKAYYVKSEHVLKSVGHHVRLAPRPKTHQRTVSLDKPALTSPRLPERSCSQSPPPLPPKSPRVVVGGRPRSKTMVLPSVARRQTSCDVQMRLRQLLSHSSSTDREIIGNGYRRLSDEDARRLDDQRWLDEDDSSAFDSKTVRRTYTLFVDVLVSRCGANRCKLLEILVPVEFLTIIIWNGFLFFRLILKVVLQSSYLNQRTQSSVNCACVICAEIRNVLRNRINIWSFFSGFEVIFLK